MNGPERGSGAETLTDFTRRYDAELRKATAEVAASYEAEVGHLRAALATRNDLLATLQAERNQLEIERDAALRQVTVVAMERDEARRALERLETLAANWGFDVPADRAP